MRASTLFAVTIAILLGLAAAITVKITGYFNQPVATVQPKLPEINVLVAARNIFKGDMVDGGWVTVRTLRADEIKDYELNKDKYLPPVPNAAVFRITATNIETDKPILKEYLIPLDQTKPGTISSALLPNMRAVNLSLPKEQSVGGMIQVGEWVDVLFTTQITVAGVTSTRTAAIAHKIRVIAKRNTRLPIYGPLPDDKPVHYTLEMNPYRAALVEYCKTKGILSMMPVSAAEQKTLEDHRVVVMNGQDVQPVVFAPPQMEDDPEYKEEDERVDALNSGKVNIGTRDLARIFGIQTKEPPLVKDDAKRIHVETMVGNKLLAGQNFNADGSVYLDPNALRYGLTTDPVTGRPVALPKPVFGGNNTVQSANSIDFGNPEMQFQLPGEKPGCKSCKKKKEGELPPE